MSSDDETPYDLAARLEARGEPRVQIIAALKARGLSDNDIALLVKPVPAAALEPASLELPSLIPAQPTKRHTVLGLLLVLSPWVSCGVGTAVTGDIAAPVFWWLGALGLVAGLALFFMAQSRLRTEGARFGLGVLGLAAAIGSAALQLVWGVAGVGMDWHFDMTSGRPVWRRGKQQVAQHSPVDASSPAGFWQRLALSEHASIAAFSRLSLQLLQLGAPLRLVEATHRAALDEAEHARQAFAIAGCGAPGAFADITRIDRPGDPAEGFRALVSESLRDGAVAEGVAAEVARQLVPVAGSVPIRGFLQRVAADEQRHAELAWEIIEWALQAAPVDLRAQLASFCEEAQPAPTRDRAGCEALGIPDSSRWDAVTLQVRAQTRERVTGLLALRRSA